METRGNKSIKIIGVIFIVALMIFFVKGLINEPIESTTGAAVVSKILSKVKEVDPDTYNPAIPDGMFSESDFQEVFLSWGVYDYKPKVIRVKKDIPVRLTADTDRLTGCYRSFIIKDFNIKKSFNENDKVLEFMPSKKGEYIFGCAMGMGVGTLIVEWKKFLKNHIFIGWWGFLLFILWLLYT